MRPVNCYIMNCKCWSYTHNSAMDISDDDSSDTYSETRSVSPAPSLYSFHSSVDGRLMFREIHGRTVNNQNETYFLPADMEEHQRLDLQHKMYTMMLGSLYPAIPLVRWALRPRPDRRPTILDVGTGSGSWAIDIAKEFPHCEVVGVDLVPPKIQESDVVPENCRFELDDANLGFVHYRESFDVVHARAVALGIRDFPAFIGELASTLRPGGVLLLGDGEMQLYDDQKQALPFIEPCVSATHRVFFAAYNAMKARGSCTDSPSMTPSWLRNVETLTDVGWHKVFIPIGPWMYANERERVLAEMLRSNTLAYISGMKPLLLSEGYTAEAVEKMLADATNEVKEGKIHLHARWSFAWAMKKL